MTKGGRYDKGKMGMTMNTKMLQSLDKRYLWHPFTDMWLWLADEPVVIDRGQGVYVYDTDGNRYIDGVSSLWCNVHGHNHKHINEAICAQVQKISHSTLLGLASGPSIELGRRLVEITPGSLERVFYSDSGATAVEIALKMAFQYWQLVGQERRQRFIALKQSYHGDTMGSVSVGGISAFHRIFGALTFDVDFVDGPEPYRFAGTAQACCENSLRCIKELLERRGREMAAIIVEPLVQGAAGIIVHPDGFLAGVSKLCKEYDLLLIVDEVATGFGRTGKMFACEYENVEPDLMCVAKGITGGYLPLAATLTSKRIFDAFAGGEGDGVTFYHGHTYTGNAVACAAAIANLEVFEQERTLEGLSEKIALIGRYLDEIAQLPYVGDVRQCGMMAGIELVAQKDSKSNFACERRIGTRLCQMMRRRGVMLRPLGDVIVLMPPLSIGLDVLDELLKVVAETLLETKHLTA